MAAQKGSALLLKATLSGTESTVAGLRSTSMTINGEMVDITTKDSDALVSGGVTKARELLEGGGVSNMAISASGVFTDSALENDIRVRAQKGQIDSYKLVFGDGDNIVGGDLLAKEASPEKPKKDSLPNIIGGITGQLGNIMPIGQSPIVASPFTTATPTSQIDPITFDSANLNKLIEMLTGVPSKPVTAKQDGGLVAAVDEFLASGQ